MFQSVSSLSAFLYNMGACDQVLSKSGEVEKKEVLLEDHDPIWLELWHAHIADVRLNYFKILF